MPEASASSLAMAYCPLPHPGLEKIVEMYYSWPLLSWRATVDYQLITNPAYNQDRGPVSVIATRVRAQF
jgi:high affinity Mn2+ porin